MTSAGIGTVQERQGAPRDRIAWRSARYLRLVPALITPNIRRIGNGNRSEIRVCKARHGLTRIGHLGQLTGGARLPHEMIVPMFVASA